MTVTSAGGAGVPPTLAERVFALVARYGSPEEQQVVRANDAAIKAFLDHPSVQLASRRTELDLGLENAVVLKFNLIASGKGSPWAMVDRFADWAPSLRETSELVLRHKLHCHVGLKVSRKGVEYELYPTETRDGLLAAHWSLDGRPVNTGLPVPPYCYGHSSDGTLSAYSRVDDVAALELEEIVGFEIPSSGLKTRALFHSRRDDAGHWHPGKAGIELLPFPSHLLTAVLQHFSLRFAYLLHRGGSRSYGVIGVKGARQVFYTTLVPRPPLTGWQGPPA